MLQHSQIHHNRDHAQPCLPSKTVAKTLQTLVSAGASSSFHKAVQEPARCKRDEHSMSRTISQVILARLGIDKNKLRRFLGHLYLQDCKVTFRSLLDCYVSTRFLGLLRELHERMRQSLHVRRHDKSVQNEPLDRYTARACEKDRR
jgi:hypothetical protein